MKGRYHLAISLAIAALLIIPLVFLENKNPLTYGIAFIVAIIIGSLTPDADCGGKAKIYYDFQFVYYLMLPIMWITRQLFNLTYIKKKLNLEYEVKEEHRGIMHAPIGILISSFLLTIILSIFLLIIRDLNIIFVFVIFVGLIVGQLLHLIEDTCTVSGIKWKFPFKQEGELRGGIYTFESKESEYTDIRPMIYSSVFGGIAIVLFLFYALNMIKLNLILLYLLSVLIISFEIFIMLLTAQVFSKDKDNKSWQKNKEDIKQIKKQFRMLTKNASKIN